MIGNLNLKRNFSFRLCTFFVTPYSVRRADGYSLNELSYALYQKKIIIPIMIDFVEPPLSICRIQYLDFQKFFDEISYNQKISQIISVLKEEKKLDFDGRYATLFEDLNPLNFDSVREKHIYGFVGVSEG